MQTAPRELTLRLAQSHPLDSRAGGREGEVAGWLIIGDGPDDWLAVLSKGSAPLLDLRLFRIGRTGESSGSGALLVLPKVGAAPGDMGRAAQPLQRFGSVLIPAGASFDPPLTEPEATHLFPLPIELFHPRFGRVAFEEGEMLRARDLLVGPVLERAWNAARPGTALPRTFGPIIAQRLTLADLQFELLGKAQIGTEPIEEIPKAKLKGPPVPKPSLLKRSLRPVARAALRYTRSAPETAKSRTWVNRVEDWAKGVMSARALSNRIHSIEQLMELLRKNPDLGLRYAIPTGGDDTGFTVRAELDLAPHEINFDMARLGGGRAGSAAELEAEQYAKLTRAYEQLAREAIAAADHRRAAYIYAHLLSDLRRAAVALDSGGHHREAAVLWMERLQEPAAAAESLSEAGLTDEAVKIWVELGDHESAAQALARAGRTDDASQMYRLSVAARLKNDDRVGAASVLDKNLRDVDQALTVLSDVPRGGRGEPRCRAQWFALLNREGRAQEVLPWLEDAADRLKDEGALVEAITSQVPSLTDSAVRERAEDIIRRGVAERLLDAGKERGPAKRWARSVLPMLDPTDRLLARDIARQTQFDQSDREGGERVPVFSKGDAPEITESCSFSLDLTGDGALESWQGGPYGLLHCEIDRKARVAMLTVIPWRTPDDMVTLTWRNVPARAVGWCVPSLNPGSRTNPAWLIDSKGRLAMRLKKSWGAEDDGRLWTFGTPKEVPDDVIAAQQITSRELWLVLCPPRASKMSLVMLDDRYANVRSYECEAAGMEGSVRIGFVGRKPMLIDAFGDIERSERPIADEFYHHALDRPMDQMQVSESVGARKSLSYGNGVTALFYESAGVVHSSYYIASMGTFVRSGAAIVVEQDSQIVVRVVDGVPKEVARKPLPEHKSFVVAIVAGEGPSQWALVYDDETVTTFVLR